MQKTLAGPGRKVRHRPGHPSLNTTKYWAAHDRRGLVQHTILKTKIRYSSGLWYDVTNLTNKECHHPCVSHIY